MPRADTARVRDRADEGATLVLLHRGEVADSVLAGHVVAVLFAAATPLDAVDLARVLEISPERLADVLDVLDHEPPLGLALQRHAGQLQLVTAPSSAALVERYLGSPPPVRLSRAALEALAVVAYRQPVTRGEIDAVRGVNSDSAVATLLSRGLVAEIGRKETIGRPTLLAITPECLQYLGLRSLDDLPPLPPTSSAIDTAAPAETSEEGSEAPPSVEVTNDGRPTADTSSQVPLAAAAFAT